VVHLVGVLVRLWDRVPQRIYGDESFGDRLGSGSRFDDMHSDGGDVLIEREWENARGMPVMRGEIAHVNLTGPLARADIADKV